LIYLSLSIAFVFEATFIEGDFTGLREACSPEAAGAQA
jgi:hypothetical protein